MSLYLDSDVFIRNENGVPSLCRAGTGVIRPLNVSEALALTFLGATGDVDIASMSLSGCLPAKDGAFWVDRAINRFCCYLGGEMPRKPDLSWLEQLNTNKTFTVLQERREPAPYSLIWIVTLGCNRRCQYCFYDIFSHDAECEDSPRDATFPLRDAIRMVQEMGRIGTSDLYFTGGEPLLRRDLPQIIATATSYRVRTHLTTKYAVNSELATQLADAGLTHVTFSLDDAREDNAATLVRGRNFLSEARRAIRAFVEAGIELEVNTVLTAKNFDGLEKLVELLIELGVGRFTLSPYCLPMSNKLPVQSRAASNLNIQAHLSTLNERYGDRIEIESGSAAIPESEKTCSDKAVCDVGFRDLHILPNGNVTRCRYLPERKELVVGSLRKQTILEIWNDRPLATLNRPIQEQYARTACTDCCRFDACNSRGRCYYTALSHSGQLFAPDVFCQQGTRR